METIALILISAAAITVLLIWMSRRAQRLKTQERLASTRLSGELRPRHTAALGVPEERIARWLHLAGRRQPDATARFWMTTAALALLGGALGVAAWSSGLLDTIRADLEAIPGRVGYLFVPIVIALPAVLPLAFASVPTVSARRARRERTRLILRDLYPALELFASLAQAGLAFDAALARVLSTLGSERPLGRELMTFQSEVLGGSDRKLCFRRLARRIELAQVSSFPSALIRAHEVGIGLADTLRRQADDLRNELRERALSSAQSLPARLVFPLVICFLPGIFVMSLGPAFYGFLVDTAGFGSTR